LFLLNNERHSPRWFITRHVFHASDCREREGRREGRLEVKMRDLEIEMAT
jgi:hypothetical protein